MRVRGWLLLSFLVTAGCAHVRPWERGRLASPAMQFEYDGYAEGQESSILEITEGALIKDPYAATVKLESLSRLGVRLAVDDCGCH